MIKGGKVIWNEVLGELEVDEFVILDVIFNVVFLIKLVFVMFVLKLVEFGEWDLDSLIYLYWIDYEIKEDVWYELLII